MWYNKVVNFNLRGDKMEHVTHELEPVFEKDSKILILGSIPSPKSRQSGFYYGHPQNRFWPLLAELLGEPLPTTNKEKKALLLRRQIALWDVLASCEIRGAEDASIASPTPNDIASLIRQTQITAVFTNGQKATELYRKFCENTTGMQTIPLPSTSPANRGRFPMERLLGEWQVILKHLSR